MSIFEKTKRCTSKFPCRYKLVMMVSAVAIAASVIVVPFIADMA